MSQSHYFTQNIISQFFHSPGIAYSNASNSLYVANTGNNCVQIIDLKSNSFLDCFGSKGVEDGQFGQITDIVASSTNVFVLDTENARVSQYDNNGNFISKFGKFGSDTSDFQNPYFLTLLSNSTLGVYDENTVKIYDINGTYIPYGSMFHTMVEKGENFITEVESEVKEFIEEFI